MEYVFIGGFTFFTLVVAYFILTQKKYKQTQSLFTDAERQFLFVLDQAVGPYCRVFAKVRVADLVEVNGISSSNKKAFFSAFNQIGMKHIDYVLVNKSTLKVLVLIELDDRSHMLSPRIKRDKFLDELFASVKLPLIRIKVSKKYSVSAIQSALQPFIDVQPRQSSRTSVAAMPVSLPNNVNPNPNPPSVESPKCSKCGTRQVLRSEPNSNKQFWACPSFPPCN